jgi:hypothetical protein
MAMSFPQRQVSFPRPNVVSRTGAGAGCILVGTAPHNQGFRIKVFDAQCRGDGGPVHGRFQILALGDNRHADSLGGLLGQVTDAGKVLGIIRRTHPACVSVVNANTLAVEGS